MANMVFVCVYVVTTAIYLYTWHEHAQEMDRLAHMIDQREEERLTHVFGLSDRDRLQVRSDQAAIRASTVALDRSHRIITPILTLALLYFIILST